MLQHTNFAANEGIVLLKFSVKKNRKILSTFFATRNRSEARFRMRSPLDGLVRYKKFHNAADRVQRAHTKVVPRVEVKNDW
jgi:hypothetical protein